MIKIRWTLTLPDHHPDPCLWFWLERNAVTQRPLIADVKKKYICPERCVDKCPYRMTIEKSNNGNDMSMIDTLLIIP